MKKNIKLKKEHGITLIALVVTIVVLLILAAISINMVLGDNGLIAKATLAKKQTEISSIIESAQSDISAWKMSQLIQGKNTSLDNATIKEILRNKDYVQEVKDASFITKQGEYEILYLDLIETGKNSNNSESDSQENVINVEKLITGEASNNYTGQVEDLGIPLLSKLLISKRTTSSFSLIFNLL